MHSPFEFNKRRKVGVSFLVLTVGVLLVLSYANLSPDQAVLGSTAAIGVQISATAEAICQQETSHRVTAEWNVTGATSPSVTITVILPNGSTLTESRNVASGQVVFDLSLEGGGMLLVEVSASSSDGSAAASATVMASPCTREGFEPEPKWSGRKTDDSAFNVPPVGSDGRPLDKTLIGGASNIVEAQYDGDQIQFQVQGVPGQQQQYGINQDCDKDGIGETWTWVFPGQTQAYVTGPDLQIMETVPVQQQEKGFSIPARDKDCAVIVGSFQRQQTIHVGELIEQVALNTMAQAIMIEGTQQQQKSTTGQQQQQQQSLKDKFCPARNRDTLEDVNGDGVPDIFYPENVQEYDHIKIEVWCISGNTFGKRVTHPDGTQGWVGKCPYVGGLNRQALIDTDGDGRPDLIRRTIVDGGSDDDGDGRLDAMVYEYNINTREHTATLTEDGQAVRSQSHMGPYPSISALPFFTNAGP